MIYQDLIAKFEAKIKDRIRIIERHQNRVNDLFKADKTSDYVKQFIRETERKQRYSRKIIDKYREEIRQLKSLQRDAA